MKYLFQSCVKVAKIMPGKETSVEKPEKGERAVLQEKTNLVLKVKKCQETPGGWALENPVSSSEEDDVEVRSQVSKKLNRFMASAAAEMKFSQKMSANKRRIAHEVAEEAGLLHQSENKGKKRRLVVRKRLDAGTQGREDDAEGNAGLGDQAEGDGGRGVQTEAGGQIGEPIVVVEGRRGQESDGEQAEAVKVKEEGGENKDRCGIRKAVPGEEAVFVAGEQLASKCQCKLNPKFHHRKASWPRVALVG